MSEVNLQRFIITVDANWCGMDREYAALAECESALDDIAEQLAFDNFNDNGCWEDIAEEEGYDPSEMSDEDWDTLQSRIDESAYYSYHIDEFLGTEEEWEQLIENGLYGPEGIV